MAQRVWELPEPFRALAPRYSMECSEHRSPSLTRPLPGASKCRIRAASDLASALCELLAPKAPFKSLVCPRLSQRQSCGLGCAPGLCHLLQGDREDGAPCITDPGSLMAPMAMHPILVPFQCPLPLLTQPSTKTGNARLPWSKWLTAAIPASRA